MRQSVLGRIIAAAVAVMLLIASVISVSALDAKYTFDEFGMSLKVPRTYTVITRDSQREDEAFDDLSLDYDETMTAFNAAGIYLQAYAPENAYKITLTVGSDENSESINNYSDLTPSQREEVLAQFTADPSCTGGSEMRHGGNIFFDIDLTGEVDGKTVFIAQDNTVINGLNINLTLQKNEEIPAEELRALNNIANTLNFDKITLKNSGPSFEWWRVLLWVGMLAVISVSVSMLYRRYNVSKKRKAEERLQQRLQRRAALAKELGDEAMIKEIEEEQEPKEPEVEQSFDEALGYKDDEEFLKRASTDLESYDISVRDRDPRRGIDFFEDDGDSINDGTDYFENYFQESTPSRTPAQRTASTVGAYIKIAFNHIGYFFRNLAKSISKIFKGGNKNR